MVCRAFCGVFCHILYGGIVQGLFLLLILDFLGLFDVPEWLLSSQISGLGSGF